MSAAATFNVTPFGAARLLRAARGKRTPVSGYSEPSGESRVRNCGSEADTSSAAAAYTPGMSSFDQAKHPRNQAGTAKGGQFAEKTHSAPETELSARPEALRETQRARRGHDFYPSDVTSWPQLYANDGCGLANVPFQAHYFVGGADWYISEIDPETGEAFGYSDLGFGDGEYGYIPLPELEQLEARSPQGLHQIVERDLHFTPGTRASEVIEKYRGKGTTAD